jgi:hypothetical protein
MTCCPRLIEDSKDGINESVWIDVETLASFASDPFLVSVNNTTTREVIR